MNTDRVQPKGDFAKAVAAKGKRLEGLGLELVGTQKVRNNLQKAQSYKRKAAVVEDRVVHSEKGLWGINKENEMSKEVREVEKVEVPNNGDRASDLALEVAGISRAEASRKCI